MGNAQGAEANTHSIAFSDDPFWNPRSASANTTRNMSNNQGEPPGTSNVEREDHREQLQRNLEEFKQELEQKHEKRRQLIAEKRQEFQQVKDELLFVKEENERLKLQIFESNCTTASNTTKDVNLQGKMNDVLEENDELKLQIEKLKIQIKDAEEVNAKNRELRITVSEMQLDVQNLNSEILNIEQERLEYAKHIAALKDVVKVTKNMLEIREAQIAGLKEKVKSVEELLASKEMKIMSDGLREEYEKQLKNIRNLRTLYEERQRLDKIDKEHLQVQLDEFKKQVENEQTISSDRLARIEELEKDNSDKYDQILALQSSLGLTKAECTELQAEIDVINQLFSHILLGFNNSPEIDFDKLRNVLEENHDLLTDIASKEESHSTAAALPKVLLDLINQINNGDEKQPEKTELDEQCAANHLNSPAEIVENLPKVWKVLIELLSHQNPPLSALKEGEKDPCYKSVETPTGPKLKLSVSQTFIRLKDLIIEKKFLEREMYRLKHLNTHLEGRLQDQEKRLELVSGELTTTWHVVEKMQKQHHQLHTHEKVLRYELHEKRKLLTELKQELQYCREKWVQARAKNDTTQEQWKELRKEFAARKRSADDFNQSAESGYSDDKDSSEEEDEKGYESDVSNGKRESDCDDLDHLDNAPLATVQATTCQENIEQFDESSEDNEMEIGRERHDCAENADSFNGDNKALEQHEGNSECSVDESATNRSILVSDDKGQRSNEVNTAESSTISLSASTGAIRKVQIQRKETNDCSGSQISEGQQQQQEINEDNLKKTEILLSSETETLAVCLNEITVQNPVEDQSETLELITTTNKSTKTPEEILTAREERLTRLEKESEELFKKMAHTKLRGSNISDRLDNLHEIYGESSNHVTENTSIDNTSSPISITNKMCIDSNNASINNSCEDETETLVCDNLNIQIDKELNQSEHSNASSTTTTEASTTTTTTTNKTNRTSEEILAAREERLQRLERESEALFKKMADTKLRGSNMSDRLDNLHEIYGESSSNVTENNSIDNVTSSADSNRSNSDDNVEVLQLAIAQTAQTDRIDTNSQEETNETEQDNQL